MKRIEILVQSVPERLGYLDRIWVYDKQGMLYHGSCSTCPNPFNSITRLSWKFLKYGWIKAGKYLWTTYNSPTKGPCLLINNGLSVECRNKRKPMKYCEIHAGAIKSKNPEWRGSTGCITIPMSDWKEFISVFDINDNGTLVVTDGIQAPVKR